MNFYSSSGAEDNVKLRDALFRGASSDGSIYVPQTLPYIPKAVLKNVALMNPAEVAYVVACAFLTGELDFEDINRVLRHAYCRPFTVESVGENAYRADTLYDYCSLVFAVGITSELWDHTRRLCLMATNPLLSTTQMARDLQRYKNIAVLALTANKTFRPRPDQMPRKATAVYPVEMRSALGECIRIVEQVAQRAQYDPVPQAVDFGNFSITNLIGHTVAQFILYSELRRRSDRDIRINRLISANRLHVLLSAIVAKRIGLPVGRLIVEKPDRKRMGQHLPPIEEWLYAMYADNLSQMRDDVTFVDSELYAGYAANPMQMQADFHQANYLQDVYVVDADLTDSPAPAEPLCTLTANAADMQTIIKSIVSKP